MSPEGYRGVKEVLFTDYVATFISPGRTRSFMRMFEENQGFIPMIDISLGSNTSKLAYGYELPFLSGASAQTPEYTTQLVPGK